MTIKTIIPIDGRDVPCEVRRIGLAEVREFFSVSQEFFERNEQAIIDYRQGNRRRAVAVLRFEPDFEGTCEKAGHYVAGVFIAGDPVALGIASVDVTTECLDTTPAVSCDFFAKRVDFMTTDRGPDVLVPLIEWAAKLSARTGARGNLVIPLAFGNIQHVYESHGFKYLEPGVEENMVHMERQVWSVTDEQ